MNRVGFKPRYYVIYTARFKFADETEPKQTVVAAFDGAGSVARYLEALRPQDRPDYHAEDVAGHVIEKIAHRDDYYSHACAMPIGVKLNFEFPQEGKNGWKHTYATQGER